jgi:hypothetical protein
LIRKIETIKIKKYNLEIIAKIEWLKKTFLKELLNLTLTDENKKKFELKWRIIYKLINIKL